MIALCFRSLWPIALLVLGSGAYVYNGARCKVLHGIFSTRDAVRMNMYIAQAKNGRFEIVESLGTIDPDEAMVPSVAGFGRGPIA